jgi:hypothetical protein
VTGYPVLPNGISWVNSVLQTCITKHKSCPSTRKTLLPKRLLSFRRLPSKEISVRIQENQGGEGKYNALSYCWGSSQTCTTTLQTIGAYKQDIPWTLLPLTFRDAILFSLELGIELLWIDALCIVQDDTKDWEIESAKMADIYQNAFITLAATVSSSGSEGCFSMHHKPVREYKLNPGISQLEASSLLVRERVKHWTVPPTKMTAQSYPLLSRGWAFQEGYLSSRALHFSSQELVWECREEVLCECGGISSASKQHDRLLLPNKTDLNHHALSISNVERGILKGELKTMADQWHSIVERYSALKLTQETDRLPALSGLAMRASSYLGKYLCGLWHDTFIDDLLWRVPMLDHGSGRSANYIGPSWSWASVNGSVKYWEDLADDLELEETLQRLTYYSLTQDNQYERADAAQRAEALSISRNTLQRKVECVNFECLVDLAGENIFGKVSSGFLQIEGHLQNAKLKYVYSRQGVTDDVALDPLKYNLEIEGHSQLVLPFFADYMFNEGPHKLPENASLQLLLIHPYVFLVLNHKKFDGVYERVGILRQPDSLLLIYQIDCTSFSTLTEIIIV